MAERTRSAKKSAATVVGEPETHRYVLIVYQDLAFTLGKTHNHICPYTVEGLCGEIDAISVPKEQVEIDVWLESPGGDAHAAYKLAVLLRSHARLLRVVVPDSAKSAATLLALAADEIYMAPAAELGPLDAQIPREGDLVDTISALDIARSLDDLAQNSVDIALERGAQVLSMTGLTRMQSLSMMLDWSAKFMEPVMRQLDPTMIHWSSTLLKVSVAYATRLLGMRAEGMNPKVVRLPTALVENYPTHGFVISREEARDRLGLPVHWVSEYDMAKEAQVHHNTFRTAKENIVAFGLAHEFGVSP